MFYIFVLYHFYNILKLCCVHLILNCGLYL